MVLEGECVVVVAFVLLVLVQTPNLIPIAYLADHTASESPTRKSGKSSETVLVLLAVLVGRVLLETLAGGGALESGEADFALDALGSGVLDRDVLVL